MKTKGVRFQCLHPKGKHAPSISIETYNLFEKAIIEILKQKQPVTFYDLVEEIENYFKRHRIKFAGAIDWFGISVKNHLEAIGVLESYTEKGKKFNRLKK